MFLVATIIDLILNYGGIPNASDGTKYVVAMASVVSAVLWLVDAILYIAADMIEINDYYRDDEDFGDHKSIEDSGDDYILLINDSFDLS